MLEIQLNKEQLGMKSFISEDDIEQALLNKLKADHLIMTLLFVMPALKLKIIQTIDLTEIQQNNVAFLL